MAIKGSGSSLSFTEIEAEFGQNGSRSLGAYRLSQNIGSLSNLPLDSGIPTSGQIKFSDFYSKRLNVVVDCHSGGQETRKSAKNDKWNNNNLTVVGGFRSKKEGGSKIIINVNKKFCSDKSNTSHCALKTGSWDSTATVQVDVGSSGRILGSGGDGGRGQNGIDGSAQAGFTGTANDVFVTQQVFDDRTNSFATYYYYWVEESTTVPNVDTRSLTTAQIASAIRNPKSFAENIQLLLDKTPYCYQYNLVF